MSREVDHPKFGLRKKMVLGITSLALVTYGTSAFFIFILQGYIQAFLAIPEWVFVIGTFFLGILWSAILGYFAASIITKPIQSLQNASQLAATGDLRHDVEVKQSDDELRALSISFNQMLSNLRIMVKEIQANVAHTNSGVEEVKDATKLAANQAESIGRTVEEIATGAERSASSILGTVGSIEQAVQLGEDVNSYANQSKNLAEAMVSTLHSSSKVVHSLVEGMNSLAEANEDAINQVRRLEQNAQEINDINNLVAEIAEQTNLLALNASIEAARAGEHGKGFAVVADEVRKLADESGQAVQKINEIITLMQREVNGVVKQIEMQVTISSKESERGVQTNQALQDVTHSVGEVVRSIEGIVQLVDKQKGAMGQIMQQIREVAYVAEQSSAGAEEVAANTHEQTVMMQEIADTADHLRLEANKLQEKIQQFTT